MRRFAVLLGLALCISSAAEAGAEKATADASSAPASRPGKSRRKKRSVAFRGDNAAKTSLRTEPLEKPSGDIWVSAENLHEEARVNIYKPDGSLDDAALAKLDELFRCVRTGEVRAMRA